MKITKQKKSFTNDDKKLVEFTQYYVEDEATGVKIAIKAVYKNDKALLKMLARRDSDERQAND